MNEKEFLVEYLEKVQEILDFILNNTYSSFYKKRLDSFKPKEIKDYADFLKIPFLTKEDIINTNLDDRVFVDDTEIDYYSTSSGTTGSNIPLIIPRIKDKPFEFSENSKLEKYKINKLFLLLPVSLASKKARRLTVPFITGDPTKLTLATKMVSGISIDAIITSPTILYMFIDELKKIHFNFKNIKYIKLSTEYTTVQKAKYFERIFPNAYIDFTYGSSEAQGGMIGYRCGHLKMSTPSFFHLKNNCFVEIIKESKEDEFGEIVYTSLEKTAFPLLRYKTGDYGKFINANCNCGAGRTIDLRGKILHDQVRTNGAIIHTQAIADAIQALEGVILPYFQANIYEREINDKFYTEIILDLKLKDAGQTLDEERLAREIESNLFLTTDKTLKDFIDIGLFLPLKIELVSTLPNNQKSKNIISHLK